jgi:hypothetical protein
MMREAICRNVKKVRLLNSSSRKILFDVMRIKRGGFEMSCTIGDIIFEHTPLWVDRNKYPDVTSEVSEAIDGSEIVFNHAKGRHHPITLQSTQETGWIRGETVVSLRALSAISGACYTLMLNGLCYTVRFRNEQFGGAIQMETLLVHSNPGADDWWIGIIYLMCIG